MAVNVPPPLSLLDVGELLSVEPVGIGNQNGHRKQRGSRGGRPVSLDTADCKNRNVIERRFCDIKQWRGLATRCDKHAVVYRPAVLIHAAIAWTQQLPDTP